MRMTPLDVQSHQFATRLRGFDPDEVTAFLRIVAEDYEGLLRENDSQAERIRRLEMRLEELSAQEHLLKETLVSAQAMTAEMGQAAERQAELRLAEVEIRAEKILDASHRRAARLNQDIREMRALRTRLAEALRSAAETHLALLETLESDPDQEALLRGLEEGTISLLKAEPRLPGKRRSESTEQPSESTLKREHAKGPSSPSAEAADALASGGTAGTSSEAEATAPRTPPTEPADASTAAAPHPVEGGPASA